MPDDVYAQLSIVVALGAAISFVMYKLRQPLIIGYILTGILAGPAALNIISGMDAMNGMGEIGIALLIFIIGLELSPRVFMRLRKTIFITTTAQVVFAGGLGFLLARLLDFGRMESAVIGLALALSSTVIIVKLLHDKRETTRLYAQIIIGMLIVQDVFVTAGKFGLAARSTDGSTDAVIQLAAMGVIVTGLLYLTSKRLVPLLAKSIGKSKEILLLFALGWGLGWALVFKEAGFSIEIGALFAGIGLAQLPYSHEMSSRLKPLRDFFIVIFFVTLGQGLTPDGVAAVAPTAIIFSLFVLFIKPIFTLITMGLLGYTKRTSFKTAVSLSQISEFSLVFAVAAVHAGLARHHVADTLTLVALITFAVSTYFIKYDNRLFAKFERPLRLFERKVTMPEKRFAAHSYPIVLFGYRRNSQEFIKTFRKMEKRFVIVDYDPDMIEALESRDEEYQYGDATDSEFLEELQLEKTQLVVSTISDFKTNEFLANWLKRHNPRAVFVCTSDNAANASSLYNEGASYVMMPHFVGNQRLSAFIRKNGFSKTEFKQYREKHLAYLQTNYEPIFEEA